MHTAGHGQKPGTLAVRCRERSRIFVDGEMKGAIVKPPLAIPVAPGRHQLIINSEGTTAVFTANITIRAGETLRVSPRICK